VSAAAAFPRALPGLLYRGLRLQNPWNYKAPALIAVPYFMIAAGAIPRPAAFAGILLSLCTIAGIAGVAYFLNDLGDIEKDRLAGRENAVAGLAPWQRALVLGLALLAALLPWRYLPWTPASLGLLGAELALFVAYCFPPLRLKERAFLGLVADGLYAHALPAVLAALTFALLASRPYPHLRPYLVSLGAWQLALGLRNIVLHQLQDYPRDLLSGTRTAAVQLGEERLASALRRVVVPFELAAFAAFMAVVALTMPLFPAAYAAFALATWALVRTGRRRPAPSTQRERLYAYLDDFYADWLPLVVLGHLVAAIPSFWPLLLGHLLLFRNAFRRWLERRIPRG
jgi:hypothetical protein